MCGLCEFGFVIFSELVAEWKGKGDCDGVVDSRVLL